MVIASYVFADPGFTPEESKKLIFTKAIGAQVDHLRGEVRARLDAYPNTQPGRRGMNKKRSAQSGIKSDWSSMGQDFQKFMK